MVDGIVLNYGDVLPNTKEFDLTILVEAMKLDQYIFTIVDYYFKGESLHVVILFSTLSPSMSLEILNLEKKMDWFSLSKGQPIHSNQRKWFLGEHT